MTNADSISKRIPIWLDTDPGVDDAMAMALLFALKEYDVKGVSAVAGNVELEKTFRNARDLVAFFGRKDVPVYAGADRPLFRAPRTAYFVHGENGLGNVPLPASDAPVEQQPAWDALYEAAKAADGELTLVAVGPLTNVALALSKYGTLPKLLKRIVIMGGSASYGNATPAAEANIFCDAEAASTVFQCGVPIVMCGLDATMKAFAPPADRESFRAIGIPAQGYATVAEGVRAAIETASREGKALLCLGSLYMYGEVREAVLSEVEA